MGAMFPVLNVAGVGAGGDFTPLWSDTFSADVAAGSVNGSAATPGVFNRLATDANSIMAVSGGLFVWNGTCAANNNLRTATVAHLGGRAWGWVVPTRTSVSVRVWHGLFTGAGDLNLLRAGYIYTAVNAIRVKDGGTDVYNVPTLGANEHCFAVVERPTGGAYLFGRNGLTGNYKLLWVYAANTTATLLQALCENASAQVYTMDNWRQGLLSGNWATDWGLCTEYTAAPATGATIAANADGIYQFTWTPSAAEVLDIQFRRTDDDNCWIFRLDQANSKVYLYEKQAGVETERGAVGGIATTLTAGTAVVIEIRCETQNIFPAVKLGTGRFTTKTPYTSASFNQTATGLKVAGFATGANLASWPNEVALPAPF